MKSAVWETNTSGVGGNRLVTEGSEELSFTYPDVSDDAFVYCALTSKPFLPPAHPVEIDDVGRAILTVLAAPFVAVGVAGEFIVVNVLCGQPVIDTDMIQGKIGRYGYLWICDRDGLNPTEFVEGYTPRWAPKGGANRDKILFSKRDGDGVWHLWTVNRDGSNLTQLTWGSRSDIEPCWSPDGAKIAFASNRTAGGGDVAFGDRCYNIWVMNADGTEMKQLTSYSKFCGHPTFANNEDVYFHAYGGFLIVNWDIWRLTLAK
jgi:hypothetical protein